MRKAPVLALPACGICACFSSAIATSCGQMRSIGRSRAKTPMTTRQFASVIYQTGCRIRRKIRRANRRNRRNRRNKKASSQATRHRPRQRKRKPAPAAMMSASRIQTALQQVSKRANTAMSSKNSKSSKSARRMKRTMKSKKLRASKVSKQTTLIL